jgi:arylsulfatase
MTYKVHIGGYNFLPYLTNKTDKGPRDNFYYFTDGGELSAIRMGDWKLMFSIQEAEGFAVWRMPMTKLRMPIITNLRRDPFERAHHESGSYDKWIADRMFLMAPAVAEVKKFMATFREFPPRQKSSSWVE